MLNLWKKKSGTGHANRIVKRTPRNERRLTKLRIRRPAREVHQEGVNEGRKKENSNLKASGRKSVIGVD